MQGVDKNYDSQHNKKDVDVACSMKESINKRTSKHVSQDTLYLFLLKFKKRLMIL